MARCDARSRKRIISWRRNTIPIAFAALIAATAWAAAESAAPGYGTMNFANSCAPSSQHALETEIAKLHSFEAEASAFAGIGERDDRCAIAWWGAAMSARGNPVGDTLDNATLRKGRIYVDKALATKTATPREAMLIHAMDVYYRPYPDQIARARAYADTMDATHAAYPDDVDIAAFDGLAIIEGVDLDDKTFSRQKRAGAILEPLMKTHPEHPGAPHYLIHAYDYTALAPLAREAAEAYPTIATASSHAQHMPSHIWSMLGEWDKSIAANRASSYLADPSSGHDAIKGDIVFEHAFDFIAYARLQKGEDKHVAADIAASKSSPLLVRARDALERGDWAAAAKLPVAADDVFNALIVRFARAYSAARGGDAGAATREVAALRTLRPTVKRELGAYWAAYVDIYAPAAEAWVTLKESGQSARALALMTSAADRDDAHEKHIYLENKILPMREALGDMELALGHPEEALAAYIQSLRLAPNRYRSFLGAAQAAEAAGHTREAGAWWQKLVDLAKDGDHARPGEARAQAFLAAKARAP